MDKGEENKEKNIFIHPINQPTLSNNCGVNPSNKNLLTAFPNFFFIQNDYYFSWSILKIYNAMKKTFKITIFIVIGIFIAIQFYHPSIPNDPISPSLIAPPEVQQIFQQSCYDCHGNKTKLSWFDYIIPGYLLVRSDVLQGRSFLNFSHWKDLNANAQRAKLFDALNQVITFHRMPPSSFVYLHSAAKLGADQINTLKNYV
ncbi:MAG: heme-binding domain-containing protein, partial [Chitinophagaceae bacterium]